MGVSQCISILSLRIDIFATGQCIWLGTQLSCTVADQVVEPREVLRPTDFVTCELLGGHEVLEVLVIGKHEYDMGRALEVVAPVSEGLEYCKQFLIVDLVVELHWLHAAQVEHDWVDVTIIGGNLGDDCSDRIVRSVSLNNNRIVRVEMCQNGGLCEGCFEGFKRLGVVGAPDEWGVLVGEMNQRYDDVREPHNESAIKVGETQEGLDCLEVSWGRPDADHVGLGSVHRYASGGNYET